MTASAPWPEDIFVLTGAGTLRSSQMSEHCACWSLLSPSANILSNVGGSVRAINLHFA